jgi:hypothetical protein
MPSKEAPTSLGTAGLSIQPAEEMKKDELKEFLT